MMDMKSAHAANNSFWAESPSVRKRSVSCFDRYASSRFIGLIRTFGIGLIFGSPCGYDVSRISVNQRKKRTWEGNVRSNAMLMAARFDAADILSWPSSVSYSGLSLSLGVALR
jgi:hypothetical protein